MLDPIDQIEARCFNICPEKTLQRKLEFLCELKSSKYKFITDLIETIIVGFALIFCFVGTFVGIRNAWKADQGSQFNTTTLKIENRLYKEILKEESDSDPCSICLDELKEDEVVAITECKHLFHPQCIMKWV